MNHTRIYCKNNMTQPKGSKSFKLNGGTVVLTAQEIEMLETFMANDIVSDYGWESPEASCWINPDTGYYIWEDTSMTRNDCLNALNDLCTIGLIAIETIGKPMSYFQLTDLGREICKLIDGKVETPKVKAPKVSDVDKTLKLIAKMSKAEKLTVLKALSGL